VRNLLTPSGVKPVIILADDDIGLSTKVDYLPSVDLPQQGFNWSDRYFSDSVTGSARISSPPILSQRTKYYMKPFQYFSSHILVRLICKPAATQAQNFWVSRSFNFLDFTDERHFNEVGFNWNPSKANEIFILMPYSYFRYVAEKNIALEEVFGFLNLEKSSELIFSEGNDIPLIVNYYFAPYNMVTYNPLPVLEENLSKSSVIVRGGPYPINLPTTPLKVGTLLVRSTTYINMAKMGHISDEITSFCTVGSTSFAFNTSSIPTMSNEGNLFSPGMYDVSVYATTATTISTNWTLSLAYTGLVPVFTPVTFLQRSSNQLSHKEIHEQITQGKEEIFEFDYNPESNEANKTYGAMFSSSPREEHHERRLTEISISAGNKFDLFHFTLDLNFLTSTFPNINTREYLRHYLVTHMPIIIFRTAKNLFSNVLFRLVIGKYDSVEEVMQLPGHEWDPTSTDEIVQPYWTYQNPAVTNLSIDFTLILLTGQIDESGLLLIPFFNTSPLKYHHRTDYSPYESSSTSFIPDAARIENYILEAVPEQNQKYRAQKPVSTVAQTLKFLGYEQIGEDGETATESIEIEEKIRTDSTSKIEGQTMETLPLPITSEGDKVMREMDFNLVGNIVEDLTNLKSIIIPINHNTFGKEEVTSAKKYRLYKGLPRFKITCATSSRIGAIAYISQIPSDVIYKDLQVLSNALMFNKAQMVFWNKAEEFQAIWMSADPYQVVQYSESNTVLPTAQLGYLVISFPTPIDTSGLDDKNIKIILECNTSNIKYSRPSYSFPNWEYPGLKYTTVRAP
jgi:hypothetical protein